MEIVQNLKNYFKSLHDHADKRYFLDISSELHITDMEINGLYKEDFVVGALGYLEAEISRIGILNFDDLRLNYKSHLETVEFVIIIYQLHGKFNEELKAIKLYGDLCIFSLTRITARNYALATEAFWHLIHDQESGIPKEAIDLCKGIVETNSLVKSKKNFFIKLAQTIFETESPDFVTLLASIKTLKRDFQAYFGKYTLDTYLTRNLLYHYRYVLKTKALNKGKAVGYLNFVENGVNMRMASTRSIEHLRKKHPDLKLHSGSYEALINLWTAVGHLLTGIEILAEYYTLAGIEYEAKKYQYELFTYSVKYCVPIRTKAAVRMMMHNDFIRLRRQKLEIRKSQLLQIESPHPLYLSPTNDSELTLDTCFLGKSTYKTDLLDALSLVKSYIWRIEAATQNLTVDNDWEANFIQPQDEPDNLSKKKPRHNKQQVTMPSDIIPHGRLYIKYKDPEQPISCQSNHRHVSSSSSHNSTTTGTLVQRLEEHALKFRHLNVPVIHRPIYQRLGLHYLSNDADKAAFYLSLAVNIGFRQLYVNGCIMKVAGLRDRGKKTLNTITRSMNSEVNMHATLKQFMPSRWTVLQFSMIDEMSTGGIPSSLLSGPDGSCMGARNCAVLLVTKYQKLPATVEGGEASFTVETRVLHGFRKTGLRLMGQLETLKTKAANGLTDMETLVSVDSQMQALTDQMRSDWLTDANLKWLMDEGNELECEPKILITDRGISKLPMECLLVRDYRRRSRCITRMPNMVCLIGHLYQNRYRHVSAPAGPHSLISRLNLKIDPFKTFFLVNPDNSLQETTKAVLQQFKSHMNWAVFTGASAESLDALEILNSKDMIIYCGHGAGCRYFTDRYIKSVTSATTLFLIGCQSARFIVEGRSEAFGMIMYYLTIGCPSIFGLLWDVTDTEIDKFTGKMLSSWLNKVDVQQLYQSDTYLPVAPMPSYVFNEGTIGNVQLKTLTGKSAIVFGLPTWIDENVQVPERNS